MRVEVESLKPQLFCHAPQAQAKYRKRSKSLLVVSNHQRRAPELSQKSQHSFEGTREGIQDWLLC